MANVLKMATVADIVTLIKSGHSDRRISAVLSLDRGTVAKYRRQLQAGESPTLPGESAHPENQSCVTTENPPNAPTGSLEASPAAMPVLRAKLRRRRPSARRRRQQHKLRIGSRNSKTHQRRPPGWGWKAQGFLFGRSNQDHRAIVNRIVVRSAGNWNRG